MTGAPWLVTGASGFLGRHLLHAIRSAQPDRPLVVLVRNPGEWTAMDWTRGLGAVTLIQGTVTDAGAWTDDPALAGVAGIFHLAALVRHSREAAEEVYRTNLGGTLAMVRLAARLRCRLLFVSTSGTVGCFREAGHEAFEDAPYCAAEVARWPYYDSKVRAEREGRSLADALGVDLVIVRPPVLLGPGDHRFRASNHVSRLLQGRLPFLIKGGMHFADVRDVAAALTRVMEQCRVRPVYHLPGTICSIVEFYRMVAAAAGMKPPRWVLPKGPALLVTRLTHRLGMRMLPEPALVDMAAHHWNLQSRFAAEIAYQSRPAGDTLRDTVHWLRQHIPS